MKKATVARLEPSRVPPSDLDAEAAVLSAALLDPEVVPVVLGLLRPEQFYADANGRIFAAIRELSIRGQPVDVVTVAGVLREKARLDQIGGTPYLAQLADATPAVANVAAHAKPVIDAWRKRQLIAICQKFAAEGYGDCGDPQQFIESAKSQLTELADGAANGRTFQPIVGDAIFGPLEDPDYLVDQIIRRGSLTEIESYGGSGKTWLGVSMALCVAAGQAWLGRFPTKPGRAVYLDYENGRYEMRRRAKAVAASLGLERVANFSMEPMPAIYMPDAHFGAAVAKLAKGHDLVIVDTLKAASPGVDENDSNIRVGLDQLRRAAEQTGSAVVVLVHGKKKGNPGKNNGPTDARESGRGSSAIFDAADAVFHVNYTEGKPLLIEQTKARLGKTVQPFQVEITDGEDGAVHVRGSDADRSSNTPRLSSLADRVLELLKQNPGTSGRFVRGQLVGVGVGSFTDALELLESNGAIRNTGTPKFPKWFPTGKSMAKEDEWSDFGD
ncbi:MAG: AAA family ATPase [Pseudomonadota bacterium]